MPGEWLWPPHVSISRTDPFTGTNDTAGAVRLGPRQRQLLRKERLAAGDPFSCLTAHANGRPLYINTLILGSAFLLFYCSNNLVFCDYFIFAYRYHFGGFAFLKFSSFAFLKFSGFAFLKFSSFAFLKLGGFAFLKWHL